MREILIFTSKFCSPCKGYSQMTLSKFDESSFRKVDIDSDEGSTLSAQYNIRALPTTLLLDGDGNIVEEYNRLLSPSQFKELLNKKESV